MPDLIFDRSPLRAHLALIDQQLGDGRAFLPGERPGLVDARAGEVVVHFPRIGCTVDAA